MTKLINTIRSLLSKLFGSKPHELCANNWSANCHVCGTHVARDLGVVVQHGCRRRVVHRDCSPLLKTTPKPKAKAWDLDIDSFDFDA